MLILEGSFFLRIISYPDDSLEFHVFSCWNISHSFLIFARFVVLLLRSKARVRKKRSSSEGNDEK